MRVRLVVVLLCLIQQQSEASTLSPWTVSLYRQASQTIRELEAIVDSKELVPDLGMKFDEIMAVAMRASRNSRILERAIDARCHKVFLKQLQLLRTEALEKLATAQDEYDSQEAVDSEFCNAAKSAMLSDSAWTYAVERASLDDVASAYTLHKLRAADVQLDAARQQNNYMRLYQTYNSQIQSLQATQFTRPSIPLNAAFAWRIAGSRKSDTSLSGSYQQGKCSFQLAKLDDETILTGDPPTIIAPPETQYGLSING